MKTQIINICLLMVWAITSCKESDKQQTQGEASQEDSSSTTVKLSPAQLEQAGLVLGGLKDTVLNDEVIANGMIDVPPQNFATVSAPMGGYIKTTKVLPGMQVDKGQLLATLEHQDFIQLQQDYLQAQSKFALADKENIRQTELYKGNASSSKKMQYATADFQSAQALVKALEEKLKLLGIQPRNVLAGNISPQIFIRSPINGNVKSVNATIGKFMNPSDVMFEIVDNSHQHLELKIFEKDILKVAEDQKIFFTVPTVGTQKFEGSVYLVGRSIDNTSRTITIHGHLEKEDKERLLPGMYVNAVIIAGKNKTSVLPDEAVVMEKNQYFIFKETGADTSGATFEKINIKTGKVSKDWIEVLDPSILENKGRLVLHGAYFLNSKLINVEEE